MYFLFETKYIQSVYGITFLLRMQIEMHRHVSTELHYKNVKCISNIIYCKRRLLSCMHYSMH